MEVGERTERNSDGNKYNRLVSKYKMTGGKSMR